MLFETLPSGLRNDGLNVWFDEWVFKPGDSVPAKIEELPLYTIDQEKKLNDEKIKYQN